MKIVAEIKALSLPDREYVVFGCALFDIYGIRETDDIDLFVTPLLFRQLKGKGWELIPRDRGGDYLVYDNMEAFDSWNFGAYTPTVAELRKSAEVIDGIPFANLEEVMKWKREFGRDKDIKDVALIEEYLSMTDPVST